MKLPENCPVKLEDLLLFIADKKREREEFELTPEEQTLLEFQIAHRGLALLMDASRADEMNIHMTALMIDQHSDSLERQAMMVAEHSETLEKHNATIKDLFQIIKLFQLALDLVNREMTVRQVNHDKAAAQLEKTFERRVSFLEGELSSLQTSFNALQKSYDGHSHRSPLDNP